MLRKRKRVSEDALLAFRCSLSLSATPGSFVSHHHVSTTRKTHLIVVYKNEACLSLVVLDMVVVRDETTCQTHHLACQGLWDICE